MRPALLFAFTVLLLLLNGCANYQLGTPGELPFRSIYVEPVRNNTFAPQVSAVLSDQIVEKLQQQPNLFVSDQSQADVTLMTTVVEYDREIGATQRSDTALAQSYNLIMRCNISLRDNRTGEIIMNSRSVQAEQQAFVDGGFLTAEYQALPVLTRDMARSITNEVVSVW
ncbi:MAG: LPS assembly lipoprotein LptE [Verrucomicrobiota bacterium]